MPPTLPWSARTVGAVHGSLVLDPSDAVRRHFPADRRRTAADTYTATVTTGVKAVGGSTLAANYTNSLTVTAPSTPSISVPAFARGAGQVVNVPGNTSGGIPLTIASGSGSNITVTSASFSLTYDPTLLSIAPTGALTGVTGLATVSYTITNVDAHHSTLTATLSGSGLTVTPAGVPLVDIAASVPASAPYYNKAVLNVQNVVVNGSAATGISAVDESAYFGDVNGDGKLSALDASLLSQDAVGSGTGFAAFKDLDPLIIGDVDGNGTLAALDAGFIRQAAVGNTVNQLPAIPTGSATITAATWASNTATITVSSAPALAYAVGQTVTISGMTPSGYNGTFTIASVLSSTEFTYALATNPGTATAFGTAANSVTVSGGNAGADPILFFENLQGYAGGTFTVHLDFKNDSGSSEAIAALDEAILFDPTKYTVSNVQTGSLLTTGGATGWSTTSNVDNTVGFIRVAQSTSSPTSIANGVVGTVLTFDVTVNSSLTPGTTIPLNLAKDVTSNGSTTTTDVSTNNGPLTLNPAPTNASNDTGVDGTMTLVGPTGKLSFANKNVAAGATFTESLNFTNGLVPLNVAALDEGILFDPHVLQVQSVSTGSGLTTSPATGWSTTANFDNAQGFIRVAQSTSSPTSVAGAAVLDVLDVVFKLNADYVDRRW